MSRIISWLFVGARAALLVHFFRVPEVASWVFALSEGSGLVLTARGLLVGRVDQSWLGLLVPVCYCTPLLFVPENYNASFGWVLIVLTGAQLALRVAMVDRMSIGVPVFVKLLRHFPYTVIRHPLSLCENLIAMAFLLAFPSAWNGWVCVVVLAAHICTVIVEERFLRWVSAYEEYVRVVRFRYLPGVW